MPTELPRDLRSFDALARARRTSLPAEPDHPLPIETLTAVLDLVATAPNHHRTNPWRLCVFRDDARAQLGQAFAADLVDLGRSADDPKVLATATKYVRAPAVAVIGCESSPDADSLRRREDRDAVAAGIQTLLLGATAAGWTGFWASPPASSGAAALALCGFSPATDIVAVVYLGNARSDVGLADVPKPPPPISWRP